MTLSELVLHLPTQQSARCQVMYWACASLQNFLSSLYQSALTLNNFHAYGLLSMFDYVTRCGYVCLVTRASSSNSRVFFLALSSTILSCSLFLWVRSSWRRWRSHSSWRWRSNSRLAAWTDDTHTHTAKHYAYIRLKELHSKLTEDCILHNIFYSYIIHFIIHNKQSAVGMYIGLFR